MDNPIAVAAIIALLGTICAALIAGIFTLRTTNSRNRANPGSLAENNKALNAVNETLQTFHQALHEEWRDARREHQEMIRLLTILVERTGGGEQ